ncbi:MAG TPA: hypothetical protein VGZ48_01945 [Candidatus Acidoferrales bacterium]|jgi:hypothetical protein|nr:hypothetical protein [Candidatus Acidoferrales bacterium]
MPRSENLPYQFLLKASVPTLESFELSRLNHAANLKKQIADLIDQYLDETTAALLARAMIMRMDSSRARSVDRKRQLPAPRSITSARLLSSARTISSPRTMCTAPTISATRSIAPARKISATRSIALGRTISTARSILRSKAARTVELQPDLPFDLFAKSRAQ